MSGQLAAGARTGTAASGMSSERSISTAHRELKLRERVANALSPRRAALRRGGGAARRGVSGRHKHFEYGLVPIENPRWRWLLVTRRRLRKHETNSAAREQTGRASVLLMQMYEKRA